MRTIHKFPVEQLRSADGAASADFLMPHGARILDVQLQDGRLTLWALVDTDKGQGRATFDVYGTGWPVTADLENYVGTVQDGTGFVWHVFFRPPEQP